MRWQGEAKPSLPKLGWRVYLRWTYDRKTVTTGGGTAESSGSTELKVFISQSDSKCGECGEQLGRQAWIFLDPKRQALCLACADLDDLVFLPSGDAAVTRRAKKQSKLWAVVLKWARARRRYERQGLLVEEPALAKAEAECLADAAIRERQRERNAAERRVPRKPTHKVCSPVCA